jgi:hypothetical protein
MSSADTTTEAFANTRPSTAEDLPNRSSLSPDGTAPKRAFAQGDRRLFIALVAVLVVVFALVGSNVAANHAPKPHHVPVGIIGTPPAVTAVAGPLGRRAPGGYQLHVYTSLAAGRAAILHRVVYGAFRPVPSPLLLVASAASPAVATLLQQTFAAAARTQGKVLVVRDLAPLPSSDPRGATAFLMILSLIIAGIMGSSVIYLLGRHRPPPVRLAAMVALGVGAGLVATLATNVVIGAFQSHFLAVWGVAALFVLALAVPVYAFEVLIGPAGIAIGALMFLVIGNPASGGSSAPELLPGFWRHLSQLLPPGAAITAMRDVVYFHGHGMTHALLVLGSYAILGAAVILIVNIHRAGARSATASS